MKLNDSIIIEARELAFARRVRRESSKIWHLGDELFTEVVREYAAGVSFAKIQVMMGKAGVLDGDLPSQTAWVRFWSRFRTFLQVARRRAAVKGANTLAGEVRKSPVEFDEATIDLIRQLMYELVESREADPRELHLLGSLVLKYKEYRLKERRVEVAERRVALAEKRESERARDAEAEKEDRTPMTPEERERRMKEIFGISPEWERRSEEGRRIAEAKRRSEESGGEAGNGGEDAERNGVEVSQ